MITLTIFFSLALNGATSLALNGATKAQIAPQLNRRQRNRPQMHVGGAKVALPASGASKMRIERPQRSGRRVQGAALGVVQGGLARIMRGAI